MEKAWARLEQASHSFLSWLLGKYNQLISWLSNILRKSNMLQTAVQKQSKQVLQLMFHVCMVEEEGLPEPRQAQ